MKQLEVLEEKRLEAVNKNKKERNKGLIFLVPGIILVFVSLITSYSILIVIGAVLAVIGFVFIGKGYSFISAYNKTVKSDLITVLLKEAYEDVSYNPTGGISYYDMRQTGLLTRQADRQHMEDYFKANYKGVSFETSDVHLEERVRHTDSKGNTYYTYETFFKGRWIIYRFERQFKEQLKIIETRFGFSPRGFEKMETESIEFNKKFNVYTTSQEYAFYQITPSMIEKMLELEKMHRGQIMYAFLGNQLHIAINDGKDYLEVSHRNPITEKSLQPVIDDIELIAAIINEFRLYSQKFKEQN